MSCILLIMSTVFAWQTFGDYYFVSHLCKIMQLFDNEPSDATIMGSEEHTVLVFM